MIIAFSAKYCRHVANSTFYGIDAAVSVPPARTGTAHKHGVAIWRSAPILSGANLVSRSGGGNMTTTRSVGEGTSTRYSCVLCGRVFALPSGQPALPAHVYPRGLFRGRPCASAYGVPV